MKNVQREIQILQSISHPNIIQQVQIINTFKSINIVMEYIGEVSLFQYLKQQQKTRLEIDVVKWIFISLVKGINHIHEQGIVHRDIKLENIIVDDTLYQDTKNVKDIAVKLIDFGFAINVKQDCHQLQIKAFCGTPCYMSPELVSSSLSQFSPYKVDIWALGIVLYILMIGRFPFRNVNSGNLSIKQQEEQLFNKIIEGQVHYPEQIDVQLIHLIKNILNKNVKSRYNTKQILKHPWLQI